jgi:site-specific recombinase XerD
MSTGEVFKFPTMRRRLHAGPLRVHIDEYIALLQEQGYSRQSARVHLQVLADFSGWLQRRKLSVGDIDASTLGHYLRCRERFVDRHRGASSALNKLLGMLRDRGIANHDTRIGAIDPIECAKENFKQYLSQERGLSAAILHTYLPVVDQFLRERFGRSSSRFSELRATDLTGFIQRHAHDYSPRTAQRMVAALRAFLRYLRLRGDITTDLAASVPTVANWSYSTLPKFLQSGEAQQVLARCDRHTAVGRRNYAILLLLARLGLRAGEVVAMTLDDINWKEGRLTVRGKGGQWADMPLPAKVGKAIAAYLRRGRPRCASRRLFIRGHAPRIGFANSSTISTLVKRALAHAGVRSAHTGAHVFRHTLATEMLRHGASLGEVGQLLRHQHPDTTRIYAKVDLSALRQLALPWPGDGR